MADSSGHHDLAAESRKDGARSPSGRFSQSNGKAEEESTSNFSEQEYMSSKKKTADCKSATQYASEVNQWLWHCYYWQCFSAAVPYFMITNSLRQGPNAVNVNIFTPGTPPHQPDHTRQAGSPNSNIQTGRTDRQYRIPPLWKRFAAEFVDFVILFMLKLIVTFIAIDFFDIIDLEKYDFDTLKDDIFNYKAALEMTSEIVLLEIIHRFVVCFFEAMCLHRGTVSHGGATPGKCLLGLKVVSCESIIDAGNRNVLIRPAGDLGFTWALVRSFVKNFSLAFFFPLCFTLFMFQHNRTVYDILCNSIVVEESSLARRQ